MKQPREVKTRPMINLDIPTIAEEQEAVLASRQAQAQQPELEIDDSVALRLRQLMQNNNKPALKLRIRIRGGGCSGFQYDFDLTEETEADDHLWPLEFGCVIVDPLSQQMLNGSRLEYFQSPMESGFKLHNPHAKTSCGCGVSFSV